MPHWRITYDHFLDITSHHSNMLGDPDFLLPNYNQNGKIQPVIIYQITVHARAGSEPN